MSKLTPLPDKVEKIFTDCISNIRNQELKEEYLQCTEDIISDTKEYIQRMEQETVHEMQIKESINNINKEQMIKVYDDKLSKKGQPGRNYYDKILSLPQYGMCPYCGQRMVTTLDHFMPKTKYVSLVVSPSNLVPSCSDCNKLKLDSVFDSAKNTLINPYFTDLNSFIWIVAKIIPIKDDFVISFNVDESFCQDHIMFKRLCKLFDMLELNNLYISHAAQELVGLKKKLLRLYKDYGGKQAVIDELNENIDQCGYPLNHWKMALYRELLSNKWFLEEWLSSKVAG